MADLFDAYPELMQEIDVLCRGGAWHVVGVSALVRDEQHLYFELSRPRQATRSDLPVCGIAGIGGKREMGESILDCIHREIREELRVAATIRSAAETHLVCEQRLQKTVAIALRDHPLPVICSLDHYRVHGEAIPNQFAAIVTFWAQALGVPEPEDLFGLLALPWPALPAVFGRQAITLRQLCQLEAVRVMTEVPLDENTLLSPVWTGRSFQVLLRAGLI